ncbi:MAG: B12-binding domain-containing radical SAM protein [Firmicutes bacterium HGW-Firmicutes-7]|nr:MAG: B12-binding domain-containing radical SAM protein [Firmicutes bacterium HGW-Firmicutes-7]
MNELKLSDEILLSVDKPARYIGNEINCIYKDIEKIDIRFAFCFPDVYEIAMSHLGLAILYDFLNKREDTYCERVFSPWIDLDNIMREKNIPLFALESQDDIKNFDFLGFTVQYEMSYTNILSVLELSHIPIFSKDRSEDDPIVCAGGPCTYNPEPLADFIDFFYIGEGEVRFNDVLDLYGTFKAEGKSRADYLEAVAKIDGIYVPKLYDVTYNEDKTIHSFLPNHPNAKEKIKKNLVLDLTASSYPTKPLVPYMQVVHDRVVLELFRGCMRGCRFCQAGIVYRPVREKNVDMLKEQAVNLIKGTGHEEISLVSLSSSDYKPLHELSEHIIDTVGHEQHVNLSLPSLRIDAFSLDLMKKVQDVRKSSLTFAPEAGSQRLRDVINKGITEEDILKGSKEAFESGWSRVKLYFMLGLPTEELEDVEGIAHLSHKIVEKYYELPKELRRSRVEIVTSTSFFVPKPFTPFQWVAQDTLEQFKEKQTLLNRTINKKNIKFNSHDAKTSVIEGVIARGDRRLGQVIYEAYKLGAKYDAWSEHFKYTVWEQAFDQCGIDASFYASRERSLDEMLPWDFIDIGVSKDFLLDEYEKALQGKTTPNCSLSCSTCGAQIFGGGICYEG